MTVTEADRAVAEPTLGCWVAYHFDGSGFVPFATEIEALRYALGMSMAVKFAEFGDEDWRRR